MASDLFDELKWIAEGGSQAGVPTASIPAKGIRALGRRALILGLGMLLLGAVIGSVAVWNLKLVPSPPPRQVQRFTITLPPDQRLALRDEDNPILALSPDGSHLAYSAIRGGSQQLYLRPMDSVEARPLPGTEGAIDPFFSPNGQWLGFFSGGKLKKVSVNGGAAIILSDAPAARGANWNSEGKIVFAPAIRGVLQQVSDTGGALQPLTRLDKGEFSHRWPEFLPDGKAMLFGSLGAVVGSLGAVAVQSSTGERRNLIGGGTSPRYTTSGHLLYAQDRTLMAAPFDPKRLEFTGKTVPVAENIVQSPLTGAAQYSVSGVPTGKK